MKKGKIIKELANNYYPVMGKPQQNTFFLHCPYCNTKFKPSSLFWIDYNIKSNAVIKCTSCKTEFLVAEGAANILAGRFK